MQMKLTKIELIKPNPKNPRTISERKFNQLVQSVKKSPKTLELRPIIVDKDMVVVGGNMRLKACIEAGFKEVPVIVADNLTKKELREFTIKDNVSFGDWDWEVLANEWDTNDLSDWGLDVPLPVTDINLDDFFEQQETNTIDSKKKIVLEYTDEEYTLVKNALLKHGATPEAAVFNLLGL
jgi:hypothetical protein